MKNKKLIIYGIGKFAEYIAFLFNSDSDYHVEAFCVEKNFITKNNNNPNKIPLIPLEKISESCPPNQYEMFVAVGNDRVRERIYGKIKSKGYKFASYISTKATVFDNLKVGENTFISEDTAIQPFVSIDDNTILIGAKIGHHSKIGRNVLLSLTSIGANVIIGNNSFLGINSTVKSNISIGNNNIIGMGCIISHNTNDCEVFTAAKSIKRKLTSEDISDKYL
ncbi:hypothetical protein NE848_13855 [Gramella jeungdoensis]|uniref:Acetyltransferase n=1 Tax=Gramella jeungdoensis TaxID=708091 RepID=A0ABT0Z4M8_9FLAO|nr:hypothetical protein [Gramella jeungdoensis]MCM8570474.1 hypothetical protein [Gramella jeungdoensis]